MSRECRQAREALERSLADGDGHHVSNDTFPDGDLPGSIEEPGTEPASGRAPWLSAHLRDCPACRSSLVELRRLDRLLHRGFRTLGRSLPEPSETLVRETVRQACEPAPEVWFLRRLRRPFRVILWGALYAFTLLAACVLAAALYLAIKGRPW